MGTSKTNIEAIEHAAAEQRPTTPSKPEGPVMRSQVDDISVWKTARQFKVASLIAMTAAFSASLDGYRKSSRSGHSTGDC